MTARSKQRAKLVSYLQEHLNEFTKEVWDAPDDDVAPCLFMADAQWRLTVMSVPEPFLADPVGKQLFAKVIVPGLVSEFQPVAMALVTSSWMVYETKEGSNFTDEEIEKLTSMGVTDNPNHFEAVTMHVSDVFGSEIAYARVTREEGAVPKLGEWQMVAESAEGLIGGLMGDALRLSPNAANVDLEGKGGDAPPFFSMN